MQKDEIINSEHEYENVYKKIDEILPSVISSDTISHYVHFLDYLTRLKTHYSLFNILLVFAQNPNVKYFGSTTFWKKLHRFVKPNSRAYAILVPFGPVSFVYDINDTVGDKNTDEILDEFALQEPKGEINSILFDRICANLKDFGIEVNLKNLRPKLYGYAEFDTKNLSITINQENNIETQFLTIIHEIAHIFLAHLGEFVLEYTRKGKIYKYKIKNRKDTKHNAKELEAESIAYILCHHFGLVAPSAEYLSGYVKERIEIKTSQIVRIADDINVFFINRKPKILEKTLFD